MHLEARVALPAVLAALSVRRAILVGHSDGASIALIHASDRPPSVVGLLLEAPHVFVEELTLASIAQLRERVATPDLLERFARHHGANAGPLVAAWTDVWLSLAFRDWSLDASLGTIGCPVLVVQGEDDEYGTLEQVQRIARAVPSRLETLFLPRCGHAPHRDQPVKTLEAMTRFARGLL
jgi:pimeloyl-ACP methyl ester carboxylesterase